MTNILHEHNPVGTQRTRRFVPFNERFKEAQRARLQRHIRMLVRPGSVTLTTCRDYYRTCRLRDKSSESIPWVTTLSFPLAALPGADVHAAHPSWSSSASHLIRVDDAAPAAWMSQRDDITVKTLEAFKNEVGHINWLERDNELGSAAVKQFCDKYNIRLDSSVSKLEHISGENKLGIIDRLVRTLREPIETYYDILENRKDTLQDVFDSIIATYNNDNHRSLQNKSPNQVFKDNDNQTISPI
jgi:hypothetical protein